MARRRKNQPEEKPAKTQVGKTEETNMCPACEGEGKSSKGKPCIACDGTGFKKHSKEYFRAIAENSEEEEEEEDTSKGEEQEEEEDTYEEEDTSEAEDTSEEEEQEEGAFEEKPKKRRHKRTREEKLADDIAEARQLLIANGYSVEKTDSDTEDEDLQSLVANAMIGIEQVRVLVEKIGKIDIGVDEAEIEVRVKKQVSEAIARAFNAAG